MQPDLNLMIMRYGNESFRQEMYMYCNGTNICQYVHDNNRDT